MSDHARNRRLVVLVPDADIEQSMNGLLTRTDSLKIAPVDFEVRTLRAWFPPETER